MIVETETKGKKSLIPCHEVTNHSMHQTPQQSASETFQLFQVVQEKLICQTTRKFHQPVKYIMLIILITENTFHAGDGIVK